MKKEVMIYEGNKIEFSFDNERMMINATEMAKPFGKQVEAFMRNENTQAFVTVCLKNENSRFFSENKPKNFGLSGVESEEDLIVSRQKSGTWMHRVLALKFAAWLNPAFELWIYMTIENLLFGRYVQREQSFERTISLQKEAEELESKLEKTGIDFERYLFILRELRREKAYRRSLTNSTIETLTIF